MAKVLEQSTPATLTRTERTWRATIETPKGRPYTLSVHREVAVTDANGHLVAPCARDKDYSWSFDEIAAKEITLSGVTMTVAQIAGFLQEAFDQLVEEKKAAKLANPNPMEP